MRSYKLESDKLKLKHAAREKNQYGNDRLWYENKIL